MSTLLIIGIILLVLFLAGLLRGFALALAGLSSTCYCSYSHNNLAATSDIQGLLAIPACK